MMQIVLCEDDRDDACHILSMLREYGRIRPQLNLEIVHLVSAFDLLERIKAGLKPDLLLMDIYLPGKTGVEAVKELREAGLKNDVFFLTVSEDFARIAYDLDVLQYLVKPVAKERFFEVLDRQISRPAQKPRSVLIKARGREVRRILCGDILYCETRRNEQLIHTAAAGSPQRGQETIATRLSAGEMRELLSSFPEFAVLGTSYIVNMNHIASMKERSVVMDGGQEIGLSYRRFLEVRAKYFSFFRGEEG